MREKYSNPVTLLTFVVAAALVIVSYFGVFEVQTYARDARSMAVQGMGQDLVNLFFIAPLLIVSWLLMMRGSKPGLFVSGGTVLYILYSFVIYSFGVNFNFLFLFYCLILGSSFYLFTLIMISISGRDVSSWFKGKVPVKSSGMFMLLTAVLFYLLWLKDVLPAVINNSVPSTVSDYNLLVNPVHVLDLAIFLPGLIITAIALFKNKNFGYMFGPVLLVFIILLAVALIGMVLMLKVKNVNDDASVAFIFAVLAVISGTFLFLFFKSLMKERNN